MTSARQEKPTKKKRTRRSPEMIAQLVLEAERGGNAAEICRRENIAPNLFYRWRQKARESMVQGLKQMKRGPKAKDSEKEALKAENERLKAALCDQTIELQLLKKSVSSDYMDR
ncbi:MAG: transposase [Oligoflexus sp.]